MPGRPSGVSLEGISPSIPASQPQPMTEVAKPVILEAASMAHLLVAALIIRRLPYILKASAKVSSISTPFIRMAPPRSEVDIPSAPGSSGRKQYKICRNLP